MEGILESLVLVVNAIDPISDRVPEEIADY